jgi:hypothetical protein
LLIVAACAAVLVSSPGAHAFRRSGAQLLSVGGGIAAPSGTTALEENPAGLAGQLRPRILAHSSSPHDALDERSYGTDFLTGNRSVGVGIGAHRRSDAKLDVAWGLAATLGSSTSLGISGVGTGGLNAGLILGARGGSRIGLAAFGLTGGVDALGAGWATELGSSATFAVDGSYSPDSKGSVVKPALGVRVSSLQLAVGYGIRVSEDGGAGIARGLSLGLGIPLGRNFALEGYYNQLARYYAGLSIAF